MQYFPCNIKKEYYFCSPFKAER